jgi:Protein of unknown function (DUF2950)
MKNRVEKSRGRSFAATIAPGVFAALVLSYTSVCLAGSPSQTNFPSAEAGSRALFLAVQNHDAQALTKILGAGEELVDSDDAAQDKLDRQQFIHKYQEMHRLDREPDGHMILYIGAENWPFPIPLVSNDGVWRFDPDAGQREVLLRQIGENEINAIEACHDLVVAADRPAATRENTEPATGTLLADVESNKGPVLFQAYNFRILMESKTVPEKAQSHIRNGETPNGFALIAYPAVYRSSGVMSFIVGQDGVVYQKDLGPDTAKRAAAMTGYHLDSTWAPVPTEP